MKIKYSVLAIAGAFGLAVLSFADEQRPPEVHAQTIRIKAHGETVAELKVSTKSPLRIEGGGLMLDPNKPMAMTLISPVKGGITIRINGPGELPMTLKADEVEMILEPKRPPLFAE